MISLYKFDNEGNDVLVGKFDTQNEQDALNQYLKSVDNEMKDFKFLGELRGTVYRMSFMMTVNGIENEYYLVQR